jgi:hypothetical protein
LPGTGAQGSQGKTGQTGPQGITGATGPQGTSIQGPQGTAGVSNIPGPQGTQGVQGTHFRVVKTYSSVVALLADTAPTGINAGEFAIINTSVSDNPDNARLYLWNGSVYQYIVDLSGATGIQGSQGSQGSQGTQGIQGVQGSTGVQGSQGLQGAGFQGSQGVQGSTGSQGTKGNQGYQGNGFTIAKTYASIAAMNADVNNTNLVDLALGATISAYNVSISNTMAPPIANTNQSIYAPLGISTGIYMGYSPNTTFGISDFTIEFWANSIPGYTPGSKQVAIAGPGWEISSGSSHWGGWSFTHWSGNYGSVWYNENFGAVVQNTWQHICVTRYSQNLYMFVDGVLGKILPLTVPLENAAGGLYVGYNFSGYLSNIKVMKDVCKYTTSNFTRPIVPATNEAYTVLLLGVNYTLPAGQYALINSTVTDPDNSKLYRWTGASYEFVNDLSGSPGPQGTQGTQGNQGNQGYQGNQGLPSTVQGPQGTQGFQGVQGTHFKITKSYATVAALVSDTAPTAINSGEFAIINTGNVQDADNAKIYLWNGSVYQYVVDLSGAVGIQGPQGAGYQGAQGPQGNQGKDGAQGITGSQGQASTVQGPQGNQGYQGLIGQAGRSFYITGRFTTTAAMNADITAKHFTDLSQNQFPLVATGNPTYAATSPESVAFTTADSFKVTPKDVPNAFCVGTADYTIECWVYVTGQGIGYTQVMTGTGWWLSAGNNTYNGSWMFSQWQNPGNHWGTQLGGGLAALNVWTHVAVTRKSGTTKMWINGTEMGSTAAYSGALENGDPTVTIGGGSTYQGNIAGVRIVNGTALYTATFTPPQPSAMTAVVGTQLLALKNFGLIPGQYSTVENGNLYQWNGTAYVLVTALGGPQGYQGSQGTRGFQGVVGAQGDTGLNGADSTVVGPQGPQGVQGPVGVGAQGPMGAQGPAGVAGSGGSGSMTTGKAIAMAMIFG